MDRLIYTIGHAVGEFVNDVFELGYLFIDGFNDSCEIELIIDLPIHVDEQD